MSRTISTGLEQLDLALDGGLPHHEIAFIHGPGGSGKSTLLAWLAVQMIRAGGQVVWVDTEGFPVDRFLGLSRAHGLSVSDVLDRLQLRRAKNLEDQVQAVEKACVLSERMHYNTTILVVVDSFTGLFRLSIGTRLEQSALQSLATQMSLLTEASRIPNIFLAVSGQTWTDAATERNRPIGERTLDGWPDVTIRVDRMQNGDRLLTVDRIGTKSQGVLLQIAAHGLQAVVPRVGHGNGAVSRAHSSGEAEQDRNDVLTSHPGEVGSSEGGGTVGGETLSDSPSLTRVARTSSWLSATRRSRGR